MKYYFLTIISILISFNSFGQNEEYRSTDIKVQRLFFLIEQMYVEDVDSKKIREDLVIGMYNSLSPNALYQPDSFFNEFQIKPIQKSNYGQSPGHIAGPERRRKAQNHMFQCRQLKLIYICIHH